MVKFSEKKSMLEKFRANVLKFVMCIMRSYISKGSLGCVYVSIAVKEDKVDAENSPKFSDATEKTNISAIYKLLFIKFSESIEFTHKLSVLYAYLNLQQYMIGRL